MGPVVEYAAQKTNAPIELRIYPGANGSFTYYEDENDNYNYEKGQHSTFTLTWNDKGHVLTISDLKGKFAGMPKQHIFNVVVVKGSHGVNTTVTADADKVITFKGKMIKVKI
jgi:alpha-D-xyloside xylohydrolase